MPQHSEDEIARRRANVAKQYLQGMRQAEIARLQQVSQGQISQDLEAIRADWHESTLFDFNAAKIQELAKIDNLESTLWQAWFDSMQPLKKKSTRIRGDVPKADLSDKEKKQQPPKAMEKYEYSEERLGDPRYLSGVDRCIEKRIKILGLEAPLKIAQTDKAGNDVKHRSWLITDHTGGLPVPEPDEDY